MPVRPLLSVIVSVYDSYGRLDVLEAVLRAWQRQSLRPEVILSEQAVGPPTFVSWGGSPGVNHVLSRPDVSTGQVEYNIGRVRNAGILAASGEFLYLTDADVLPLAPNYLERLLPSCSATRILYRPSMFRLMSPWVASTLHRLRQGDTIEVASDGFCLARLAGATLVPLDSPEVIQVYEGWRYVCTADEHGRLIAPDFDPDGEPELLMKPEAHWGGTLLRHASALSVGGFAECYYGWGLEDEDFHVKLALDHQLAPIPGRSVLHFEHARRYNGARFRANQQLFASRLRRGPREMIREDQTSPTALFSTWGAERCRRFHECQ